MQVKTSSAWRPFGLRVLHAIRRNDWQPVMFRQVTESLIDPIFAAQEVALDLDEDIVATEDVDQKLRAICGTPGSARALACRIRRLAECTTNVGEHFLSGKIFRRGRRKQHARRVRSPDRRTMRPALPQIAAAHSTERRIVPSHSADAPA